MLRRTLAAAVGVLLLVAGAPDGRAADDYGDPAYLRFDLDNVERTTERQARHLTDPEYWVDSQATVTETFVAGAERQVRDAPEGRVYAGVGQLLPGGNVGDPQRYHEGDRHLVEYLNREGARIVGNVWPCTQDVPTRCPGVVVTTGSIQVTQHMYGWLARHLQANGYTVMTFDVRGQGESESTTHPDGQPFPQPANPQDEANFVDGTVDALRFLLSDANPARHTVDDERLALVGHSLGARAVSVVQQCSSADPARLVPDDALPEGCQGERWPIRAVVAYDSLSAPDHLVVPAFDHRADGYFVNAVPTPRAPDPDAHVDGAYAAWRTAGLDACTITVRAGTHAEWSQIPYLVSATRYGVPQARHYTLAWLDRYVSADRAARGFEALRDGPVPQEPAGGHLDHRASLFSGRYRSACHVTDPAGGGAPFDSDDLRSYAGVAAVGDWAALHAEPERGVVRDG